MSLNTNACYIKRFYLIFFSSFFIVSKLFAFTPSHLEKLSKKKQITYEDLAHEHIGCPENSECSKANGEKLKAWTDIFKKYAQNPSLLARQLENFRRKMGIPVMFLIYDTKEVKQTLDPIIWDSRCRHHNPKSGTKVVKGMTFFRNNPKSSKLKFVNVKVGETNYEIPYGDQPLMVLNKKLIIVKEFEEFFYYLSISPQGSWNIVNIPTKTLRKSSSYIQDENCKKRQKENSFFLTSYCRRIWSEDDKKDIIIEQDWSCP